MLYGRQGGEGVLIGAGVMRATRRGRTFGRRMRTFDNRGQLFGNLA